MTFSSEPACASDRRTYTGEAEAPGLLWRIEHKPSGKLVGHHYGMSAQPMVRLLEDVFPGACWEQLERDDRFENLRQALRTSRAELHQDLWRTVTAHQRAVDAGFLAYAAALEVVANRLRRQLKELL